MSKSKKKEEKGKRDLSIPPTPDPIFLIELEEHVLLTGFPITVCVFPCYRFDNDCEKAFEAAYDIARPRGKFIVDAVNYHLHDPHVYDPAEMDRQLKNIIDTIHAARSGIQAAWEKAGRSKDSPQT